MSQKIQEKAFAGFGPPQDRGLKVHGQSAKLEIAINTILQKVRNHRFKLSRYQNWPEYRMPIYTYVVGMYDLTLARQTTYWALTIRSSNQFKSASFIQLLDDKRQVFTGEGKNHRHVGTDAPTLVSVLEVHLYSEKEVEEYISQSLLLM